MAKPPVIVKKYANRRLYDGEESRYVTLDELAAKVKRGTDVRVFDAVTGEDLPRQPLLKSFLSPAAALAFCPRASSCSSCASVTTVSQNSSSGMSRGPWRFT